MMQFKSIATVFVAFAAVTMACQTPCVKSGSSKSTYCIVLEGCGCVATDGVNLPETTGKACKGKAKYNCKTKEVWTKDKKKWCSKGKAKYNCKRGEVWTKDKKKYCKGKGKAEYDCMTKEVWTKDKKKWCRAVEICPKGCKSGFDGCNTCKCKKYGKVGACTKKKCKNKEEPMCEEYK